jgi:hypothetical protein
VFLRTQNKIFCAKVDYSRIDTFMIYCHGCKIQITNRDDWAGYFAPCNTLLFFPLSE